MHEEPSRSSSALSSNACPGTRRLIRTSRCWGPYGRRQAEILKFTAQIWVGNELVTEMLSGPASFDAWRACWRVFRTAMLMLQACPNGPLEEYEETIRSMWLLYGQKAWGLISRADDVMRSERWERIRQRIEEHRRLGLYVLLYNPAQPWAAVIRDSARERCFWEDHVRGGKR